jgi:ribonuclease HI
MTLPQITIYTDGGCVPNPGAGGWGAILIRPDKTEHELYGGMSDTTNNRMELMAVIEALRSLKETHTVDLYVDSQYVKNGITKWMDNWVHKNWRTSTGSPVKNQDLWQTLNMLVDRHEVNWHWVKGHAGNLYNERVDQLATKGRGPLETSSTIQKPSVDKLKAGALVIFMRVIVPKNGGEGGWAIRVSDGEGAQDHSGRIPKVASTQELELLTACQIFKSVDKSATLRIYTPSEYLFKGITQWIKGWQKRDWKTANGSPVKYANTWQQIQKNCQNREVEWVYEGDHTPPDTIKGLEYVAQSALSK